MDEGAIIAMSVLPSDPPAGIDKDVVARKLAAAHRSADPAITGIYRIEAPGREGDPTEPIKLLEINANTTASGIMPVGLSSHAPSGIYFPSIVVEIHPSELTKLHDGRLALPHGWRLIENGQL
jgi:hypothetical protein